MRSILGALALIAASFAGYPTMPVRASTGPIPLNCDRACLEGVMNQYLAAVVAHDPKRLPLSEDVMYTENDQILKVGDGFWKTAAGLGNYKHYFADPEMGQVVFMGTMQEAGAALLMSGSYELSPKNFTGDLLTLVAGLLYGGYLIFVERARSEVPALPLLLLATLFGVPMLLAISAGLGEQIWPNNWTPLIIFALSSQVVVQGLLVYSIGTLPPPVVGLALLTEPAISAAVGWFAYGERLSLTDFVGAIAIAAALVLVRLPERGLPVADDQPS